MSPRASQKPSHQFGLRLLVEERDIGYTRSGGGQFQWLTTISGVRGCSGDAIEALDSNLVTEIEVTKNGIGISITYEFVVLFGMARHSE
jgi:hypothetical protein